MKIRKINTDSKGISVGIFVPVGSAYEAEDERGLAHFIEHMLFKGTKNRTYKQIAEQVDELGGSINAFTSKEYTGFYINVLRDYILEGFDILSDLVCNPLIDAAELDKEKGVIIEEINMTEDNPDDAVYETFFKNAIDGDFGKPILGTKKHISSYSRDNLLRFMGKYYKPDNFIVVASGNINEVNFNMPDSLSFSDYFADVPSRKVNFSFKSGVDVVNRKLNQSNVVMGCELFDVYDSRKYAAYLLSDILGGTMSSRLFQSIREEKSLCYHISSSIKLFKSGGLMNIFAATNNDNAQKLIDAIKDELKLLKKEYITDRELAKAKTHFKGSYILSLESAYAKMLKLGIETILYDEYISVDEIIKRIENVKLDDIIGIIDSFDLNNFHITCLGDIKRVDW